MIIQLDSLILDESTQCRAVMHQDVIDDYADRMIAGDEFPPVDVFGTPEKSWIGDGWHRVLGTHQTGSDAIDATMHPGGRTEAIRYALTANAIHGLRRTPADKKRAIEVAYTEFPGSTQQEVADLVGCTQARVSQVRPELINAYKLPERTIGKDGRERPTSYNKRNPTPPAEPTEPEQPQQKELDAIDATMHPGGRLEAIRYALTANAIHGLRRTPADKRRAIEVAVKEFPGSSQQQIADMAGCTQAYVSKLQKDNITSYNTTRVDSIGRERPTSYSKPDPTPPAEQ